MNLVNNPSNPSKTSAIPANILAALAQSLSSGQGQVADKAFADILSQNQPVQTPKNDAHANADAGTQGTQNMNANNNQNDAGSTPQTVSQTHIPQGKAQGKTAAGTTGKPTPHSTNGADKNKDAANSKTTSQASDNNQVPAQTSPVADTQTNQTGPASVAAANTVQGGDQTTNTDQNNTPSGDNADINASDAATLAADLNTVANQAATPAPQTPAVQPADTASTNVSAGDAANSNNSNTAQAANGNATDPQLILLLMQLERLAAAARTSTTTDATANAATSAQDPAAALLAQTNTNGTQGNSDLKSLMAAITKSNASNLLGNNNITDPSNSANTDQSTQSTQTPAASATPVTQQPAQAPVQQAATDKWMNNNFANLFNVANNDLANNNVPTPINVAANAGIVIGNNEGASLGTDLEGRNQGGSHDIGTNTALNNNLLPATTSAQGTNPYDFASELSAMRATKGGATGLPTPVEQVVLQLRNGLSKDGSSEMTIQLRPAELGRIDVKLNVSNDGKVQGTVTADNPATLNLLLKDVRGLERALQDAGLRADSGSLQFNLRGDGQSGGSYNQTNNNSSGFTNSSQDASTQLPVFADAAETYYLTPGGVNMRV